jgi:hypothetical protein
MHWGAIERAPRVVPESGEVKVHDHPTVRTHMAMYLAID